MRFVWTSLNTSLAVALLAACPTKDDGNPDPSATDTAATDSGDPTGPPTSTVETPTTELTSTDPTDTTAAVTETGGVTDTTDTETDGATDTTDTETDGADTETEPVECPDIDPAADATFAVTLTDWPDAPSEAHFIDVLCIVDAVDPEAGMVVTSLTCDVDGVSRPASVSIRAAPEGDVTWAAGDSVQLNSIAFDDDVSVPTRAVTMRTPDEQELLLVAVDGAEEADEPTRFEPLLYTIAELCALPNRDDGALATVTLEIPMGASISLDSGQRGDLTIDAERHYAIDLVEAVVGQCCHGNDFLKLLARRVQVGG